MARRKTPKTPPKVVREYVAVDGNPLDIALLAYTVLSDGTTYVDEFPIAWENAEEFVRQFEERAKALKVKWENP